MSAAGIACREDVEKEIRKNCISAQPKTQLTSTRLPSTGIVAKPSLKGPLSPHSIFNYAFLGRHKPVLTVLGENRFTATPPQSIACVPHCRLGCGSLLPNNIAHRNTAPPRPRPWRAIGENTGQGLKVSPAPPRHRGYLQH